MRTRLAKILVYANLCLSFVFATWALGLYTQRVDWGPKGASSTQAAGEMFKRTEEINKLKAARTRAEQHWEVALTELLRLERILRADRVWYEEQLVALENSPQALMTLAPDKQSIGGTTRPQLIPWLDEGRPVPSMAVLRKLYDQLHREIESEIATIDSLVKQEKQLTQQLIGDGTTKGLRPLIAIEEEKRQNAEKEQDYLEPLLYNRMVELALLEKRSKILSGRLTELKQIGRAAGLP